MGLLEGRRSRGGRQKWLMAVREEESGNGAGAEKTPWQRSYSTLAASGWPGVQEGTGSKCVQAAEGTGGEPKVAEQPLLQPSR